MTTLTPTESAALSRLLAARNCDPHAIVRYTDRVYVRIFMAFFVLDGDEFAHYDGMFPTPGLMAGVERITWEPAA